MEDTSVTGFRPGGGETICPPPADGSSTRCGSTSVRGRVRSPHIIGGRPAAGSQCAHSLGSCASQPACYSLCWDRQTDRQTDGSRYRSMPRPLRRRHNNLVMTGELCTAASLYRPCTVSDSRTMNVPGGFCSSTSNFSASFRLILS